MIGRRNYFEINFEKRFCFGKHARNRIVNTITHDKRFKCRFDSERILVITLGRLCLLFNMVYDMIYSLHYSRIRRTLSLNI